jgi:hypothetical protein
VAKAEARHVPSFAGYGDIPALEGCAPDDPVADTWRGRADADIGETDSTSGVMDLLSSSGSTATWVQRTEVSSSVTSTGFPLSSDAQIQVPLLTAMQAFSSIAIALDIMNVVLDPNHLHILPPVPRSHLPWNLQPTPAQPSILHHPMLDALPWPTVREKLIYLLSLPSMLRPPIAQEDEPYSLGQAKAVQRLMNDLDDLQEGTRVYGNGVGWCNSNELVEEVWEMGECFYRNWWFCIDPKAVVTSNKLRRARGAGTLSLG